MRKSIFDNLDPERQDQFSKAFPEAKPKKKSPANALTSAIIKYVTSIGGAARKINNGGTYSVAKGTFLQGTISRGTEDITCTMPIMYYGMRLGLHVGVEVKIGKDRQSEFQKEREAELHRAGGVYIIAKTFDQFKQDWDSIKYKYEQSSPNTSSNK